LPFPPLKERLTGSQTGVQAGAGDFDGELCNGEGHVNSLNDSAGIGAKRILPVFIEKNQP
jgi:hypothetical protein